MTRPADGELDKARRVIAALIRKIKTSKKGVALSTLLPKQLPALPHACKAYTPAHIVALGSGQHPGKPAPLPGFLLLPLRPRGCGTELGTPCLISYTRIGKRIRLRVAEVKSHADLTDRDATIFTWKKLSGCLLLEVVSTRPMACNRPTPTTKALEVFAYRNGALSRLLQPIVLEKERNADGSGPKIEGSTEWLALPDQTTVLQVAQSLSLPPENPDEARREVDKSLTYLLTKSCSLRKPTRAESLRLRKHLH